MPISREDALCEKQRGVMFMKKKFIKWRDVIGFEGFYKVSSDGRIKSVRNKRLLKVKKNISHGYMEIEFNINGKATYHRVHRLVAMAFLPNPNNLLYVNHKDGVKDNNKVENLEWISATDNNLHALATGLATTIRKRYTVYNKKESIVVTSQNELVELIGYSKAQILYYIKTKSPLKKGNYKGYFIKS